jgi:putative oxidoreductase
MNEEHPKGCPVQKALACPFKLLILGTERIASHFLWAGPLLTRIVVGYVFMLTGWGKLQHLPAVTENFIRWGIPYPHVLTPLVAGIECYGGLFLILGLFTRFSAGALAVVMAVAIYSAKRADIDSFETLFGFEEASYFVIFFWLSIAGAGKASLDYLITRKWLKCKTACDTTPASL